MGSANWQQMPFESSSGVICCQFALEERGGPPPGCFPGLRGHLLRRVQAARLAEIF